MQSEPAGGAVEAPEKRYPVTILWNVEMLRFHVWTEHTHMTAILVILGLATAGSTPAAPGLGSIPGLWPDTRG